MKLSRLGQASSRAPQRTIYGFFDWGALNELVDGIFGCLVKRSEEGFYFNLEITNREQTVRDGYGGWGIVEIVRAQVLPLPVTAMRLAGTLLHTRGIVHAEWRLGHWPLSLAGEGTWVLRCDGQDPQADEWLAKLEYALKRDLNRERSYRAWWGRGGRPETPTQQSRAARPTLARRLRRLVTHPWFIGVVAGVLSSLLAAALVALLVGAWS